MKSDVILKRSRHDARRTSVNDPEDTPLPVQAQADAPRGLLQKFL